MEEFDLRRIYSLIFKRKKIIFLVVIPALAFAFLMSVMSPKIYESTGTMLVYEHQTKGTGRVKVDPQWYVNTQMELMKSQAVVRRVALQWTKRNRIEWDDINAEDSKRPSSTGRSRNKKGYLEIDADRKGMVGKNQFIAMIKGIINIFRGGGDSSDEDAEKKRLNDLISNIKQRVAVTNKYGSNFFYLTVEADNPQLAAGMANALMTAYRKENLSLKEEELADLTEKVKEQEKEARADYIYTRQELKKLSKKYASLLNKDLRKIQQRLNDDLNKVEKEYQKIKDQLSANHPRVKALKKERITIQKELDEAKVDSEKQTEAKNDISALQAKLGVEEANYLNLQKNLTDLKNTRAELVSDAQIAELALVPAKPTKPKIVMAMSIALIASGMFGVILAFLLEFVSRSVKSEGDMEKHSGARPMCTLKTDDMVSFVGQIQNLPEQYRLLRTAIMSSLGSGDKTILITGTQKENDVTPFIAANLAMAFSLLEERQIMLVDADLRTPRLHEMFNMEVTYGLVDYLIGALKDLNAKSTEQNNLKLITAGQIPNNPAELLESKKMDEVLQIVGHSSDIVIVCCSSLAAFPDATVLASHMDKTLLTATVDETSIEDAAYVKSVLEQTSASVMGSVLVS